MLVNIIGAPGSGKTTTAALVFAQLKENGLSAEFISEQARIYIAEKRRFSSISKIELSNYDQISIMDRQLNIEVLMTDSVVGSECVVVSDTSPINALLYIDHDKLDPFLLNQMNELIEKSCKISNLVYIATPFIQSDNLIDLNRIHNSQQSKEINNKIPEMLKKFAPNLKTEILVGSPIERSAKVLSDIYSFYNKIKC